MASSSQTQDTGPKPNIDSWHIFTGKGTPHGDIESRLPEPPPWRTFTETVRRERGSVIQVDAEEVEMVNAALYLRRPLMITGKPGTGKTSLAYAVAYELQLGHPLVWPITTRATLRDGLYRYDAVGRLQEASLQVESTPAQNMGKEVLEEAHDVGRYLRLGPLGTALLPSRRPRVLLIDEIDKSDIDLPNDLLHVFEEGEFEIPELARLQTPSARVRPWDDGPPVTIEWGRIRCDQFPLVFLTSNGEREFPPAFIRRCLRLQLELPDQEKLLRIVQAHFTNLNHAQKERIAALTQQFLHERDIQQLDLATDQLLNAVYLTLKAVDPQLRDRETLLAALWKSLSESMALE